MWPFKKSKPRLVNAGKIVARPHFEDGTTGDDVEFVGYILQHPTELGFWNELQTAQKLFVEYMNRNTWIPYKGSWCRPWRWVVIREEEHLIKM